MIKRIMSIFLLINVLLTNIVHGSATPVYTGYTAEGIRYEIFEDSMGFNYGIPSTSDSRRVEITIRFDGIIQPPLTYFYTRKYNNDAYSGELKLKSYTFKDQRTSAKYAGMLYKNE